MPGPTPLSATSLRFCPRCYSALAVDSALCSSCEGAPQPASPKAGIQGLSDRVADTIGVERIEGFSARAFFSDLLKRRTAEELESHFASGFPGQVPDPASVSAEWPRPWAFLRVLAAGLALYAAFDAGFSAFENPNLIPGLIMAGSFAMPVAMVVFFFEMNIWRNISIYHLVRLFLLGGVASLVLALGLDALVPLGSLVGAPAAGLTEEAAKLAIVALALQRMRLGAPPKLLNGMLVGAAVGAGFAAFESAGYAFQVLQGAAPGLTVVDVLMLRGVLSPFAHIAWTAITSAALWRVSSPGGLSLERLSDPRFVKLFGLAVVLHVTWDLDLPIIPPLAKYAVLGGVAVVAVLSLLQSGIRQAGQLSERPGTTVPATD